MNIIEKFELLGIENAPGQESPQEAQSLELRGEKLPGDKVAIVEPYYFANRKMAEFFGGEKIPIPMNWHCEAGKSRIDLAALEAAFKDGAKVFLFSNPNNPTGCVYSRDEIASISSLAKKYDVALIVDELYSRQIYPGIDYTHAAAEPDAPRNLITIIDPSKTESLSGFILGAAYGTAETITRMEKLQAIMSLRCPGYNQAVFSSWFNEPAG